MKKVFYVILIVLLSNGYNVFSQNKSLVFVGSDLTSKDGQVLEAIVAHGGYDITEMLHYLLTEETLPTLNSADVVIMGRSIGSGDVGASMDLWDKVTAPVLSMNPWGLRNLDGKAKWVNSDGCSNLVDDVNVVVEATVTSDDPVFGGTKGAVQWWNSCYSAFIPDEDNNDAGNGTLLLASSDNRPLFIRWNANEEFFPEAGHSPSGPRTYMGLGQDNVEPFVYFGFSEFAKTVFFNELERMAALSTNAKEVTTKTKTNAMGVIGGIKLHANSNACIYSISGTVIAKNINAEFVSCPKGIYLVQVHNTVTKIFVTK